MVGARVSYISIHSPRMGRDEPTQIERAYGKISIHSPRMGRDIMQPIQCMRRRKFQSTLPAWGETWMTIIPSGSVVISIHSPRMGRDPKPKTAILLLYNFNPLSPHGERPCAGYCWACCRRFQSTLPAWGETWKEDALRRYKQFQSTLPAWGETMLAVLDVPRENFNPLSPHGERRQCSGP